MSKWGRYAWRTTLLAFLTSYFLSLSPFFSAQLAINSSFTNPNNISNQTAEPGAISGAIPALSNTLTAPATNLTKAQTGIFHLRNQPTRLSQWQALRSFHASLSQAQALSQLATTHHILLNNPVPSAQQLLHLYDQMQAKLSIAEIKNHLEQWHLNATLPDQEDARAEDSAYSQELSEFFSTNQTWSYPKVWQLQEAWSLEIITHLNQTMNSHGFGLVDATYSGNYTAIFQGYRERFQANLSQANLDQQALDASGKNILGTRSLLTNDKAVQADQDKGRNKGRQKDSQTFQDPGSFEQSMLQIALNANLSATSLPHEFSILLSSWDAHLANLNQQVATHQAKEILWEQGKEVSSHGNLKIFLWKLSLWLAGISAVDSVQVDDHDLKGWLTLAELFRSDFLTLSSYDIPYWLEQYGKDHPAAPIHQFIQELWSSNAQTYQLPDKLLVALPFSGPYETAGHKIRSGILAAFYSEADITGWWPELIFADSAKLSSQDILSVAENNGASYIIGPLTKTNTALVAERLQYHPFVKGMITLNTLDFDPVISQKQEVWSYSLAAEQEIKQLVEYAAARGYSRGLGAIAESVWGVRSGHAFEDNWVERRKQWLGSEGVSTKGISKLIGKDVLHIEHSELRKIRLQRFLDQPLEFLPRRREDVDFIFHASNRQHISRLLATLKFNYTSGLPIFTLSTAYQPHRLEKQNDIEGIIFTELPWMLPINYTRGIARKRSDPQELNRFFAMGIDSYKLLRRLLLTGISDAFPYYGVTGSIRQNRHSLSLSPMVVSFKSISEPPEILLSR